MEKIKVCHFASGDLWAGAEAQIAMLLRALSRYEKLELSVVLHNHGRLARELEKEKVPVTILDETKLHAGQVVKRLSAHLAQGPADILHTHGYKEHILGSFAAKLSGVGHVIKTVHGLREPFAGIDHWKMSLYTSLDDLIAKYLTDAIVAVSQDIYLDITKRIRAGGVVTIHNGIEVDRVKPSLTAETVRKNLGVAPDAFVIGTVGRLVPVKGIDYFLRAAKSVADATSNVTFLIVGEGPEKKNLEKIARAVLLKENVIFTGYREDVYDLINAMDLFVLSSLHEGIPTVLLEAMVLRTPIVATAVGGIPEVIRDGETGFLVESKNVGMLADRMSYVINNRSLARQISAMAYDRVKEEYSTVQQADMVYLLYTNTVNGCHHLGHV